MTLEDVQEFIAVDSLVFQLDSRTSRAQVLWRYTVPSVKTSTILDPNTKAVSLHFEFVFGLYYSVHFHTSTGWISLSLPQSCTETWWTCTQLIKKELITAFMVNLIIELWVSYSIMFILHLHFVILVSLAVSRSFTKYLRETKASISGKNRKEWTHANCMER